MTRHLALVTALELLYRLRLRHLGSALFARAALIVIPEIEHRLTEVLDNVAAIEINVFYEGATILAVENNVFMFSRRTAALDDNANRVGWTDRSVGHIRWNEKCFSFAHQMIHDSIAFADAHFDVALQLVKILFRIDQMKIVSRVGALDDHHEKIASIIKITVANRRLELVSVFFDPIVQINGWLHGWRAAARRRRWRFGLGEFRHEAGYLLWHAASNPPERFVFGGFCGF
jgi:hypothetical protein